jgi:beta-galactosidase
LTADRSEARGDGEDVVLVSAEVVDAAGRPVPGAEDEVEFGVEGGNGAAVIGVGNGDPSSHEADKGKVRRAFHGRCMAIVKVGTGAGALRVTARAAGLPEAVTQIGVQAATPRPRVAIVR